MKKTTKGLEFSLLDGGVAVLTGIGCSVEEHIVAELTGLLDEICDDSCLEFFVNFNPAQPLYINFEMNANGAFLSALRPGRKGKTPIHELLSDLPAVYSKQYEDRWTVDAFFSLAQIDKLFGKKEFVVGDVLKGNFYKCGDETPIPHFGMWAPIDSESPDFHRPEFFGDLVIGGKE